MGVFISILGIHFSNSYLQNIFQDAMDLADNILCFTII